MMFDDAEVLSISEAMYTNNKHLPMRQVIHSSLVAVEQVGLARQLGATSFVTTGFVAVVAAVVEGLIEAAENAAVDFEIVELVDFVAAINTGVFVGVTLIPG